MLTPTDDDGKMYMKSDLTDAVRSDFMYIRVRHPIR